MNFCFKDKFEAIFLTVDELGCPHVCVRKDGHCDGQLKCYLCFISGSTDGVLITPAGTLC